MTSPSNFKSLELQLQIIVKISTPMPPEATSLHYIHTTISHMIPYEIAKMGTVSVFSPPRQGMLHDLEIQPNLQV